MNKLKRIIQTNIFFLLLVTAAVFLLYGKSINYDFTYHDDNSLVLENINYLSDISNIHKLFLTSCYYSKYTNYYRPVLNLSFVPEAVFFNTEPYIYHLVNIFLFIFALFFIYIFIAKLGLNKNILKFIILLISVHPMFTSCVVWIPARNDTLLVIFICLSFIFLKHYIDYNKKKFLFFNVLFFTLALFTKESALPFLLLYFLFLYCFKVSLNKKHILIYCFAFFLITTLYFCLRNISVLSFNSEINISFLCHYFYNFILGTCIYISKFLIPDYTVIMLHNIKLSTGDIAVNIFVLLLFVFVVYKKVITKKCALFVIIWFIISLSMTFLIDDYVYLNHRFMLSLPCVLIILVSFIEYLLIKYTELKKYIPVVYTVFIVIFSYSSFLQADKYADRYIYWTSAYADAPEFHGTVYGIARLYLENNDIENAKKFLNKISYMPVYLSDWALISMYEKDYDKAEKLFFKSVELDINKGQCYRNLSAIYFKRDQDINKAIEYAQYALAENTFDTVYLLHLAALYMIDKQYDKAIDIYESLVKYDKTNHSCFYQLSFLNKETGNIEKAKYFIDRALDIDANNSEYQKLRVQLNE